MGIFKRGRPSRQEPPRQPGIYRFRNKDTGKIDYIGESANLIRRISEQFRSKNMSVSPETHYAEWKIADGRSTSRTRRAHETREIEQHQPRLNRRRGGGGRRARR